MVLVGGYTRLTLAGLSMTDWTFRGSPMPSSEEAWTQQFDKYKMTPEYRKVHYGISLDEFKNIYFTEWFHRMFGRLTGVAFAGGLAYFGIRGILRLPMLLRTSACLAIGGFQGLVGWYMVKSGLNEPKDEHAVPRVSPYRLVFHLATAVALYTALLWNAMTLLRSRNLSTAINANIQNCGFWVSLDARWCLEVSWRATTQAGRLTHGRKCWTGSTILVLYDRPETCSRRRSVHGNIFFSCFGENVGGFLRK
eukprot:GHVQ01001943.1.p1 GENE.GHVQ01001943.1~~GHVQ01001943.1.p1  ORF type:complete len:251 (+),score=5.28 GHVQ01001943.1:252-1004(+)